MSTSIDEQAVDSREQPVADTTPSPENSDDSSDNTLDNRATNPIIEAFTSLFADQDHRSRGTSFPGNLPFDSDQPLVLPSSPQHHSTALSVKPGRMSTGSSGERERERDGGGSGGGRTLFTTGDDNTSSGTRRDSEWEEIEGDEEVELGGLAERQPVEDRRVSYLDDGPQGPQISEEDGDSVSRDIAPRIHGLGRTGLIAAIPRDDSPYSDPPDVARDSPLSPDRISPSSIAGNSPIRKRPTMKGYLDMAGLGMLRLGLFSQVHKRYVVLEGDKLYYSERAPVESGGHVNVDSSAYRQPSIPIKCIDLATATNVEMGDDGASFTITTPERTYTLSDTSKTDTHQWFQAVRYAYLGNLLYEALVEQEALSQPWQAVVHQCLQAGVTLNPELGARSESPLFLAVSTTPEIVSALLKKGANPCVGHINGDKPLHRAVVRGHLEIIRLLLQEGADPLELDHTGAAPIHLAFRHLPPAPPKTEEQVRAILRLLIKENPKMVDIGNKYGTTALMLAALAGYLDAVTDLIGYGANINATNKRAQNAGHFSLKKEGLQMLARVGLDTGARDMTGRTALEMPRDETSGLLILDGKTRWS